MNLTQLMSIVAASSAKDWNHIICWGFESGPSYRDQFSFSEFAKGQSNLLHVTSHSDVAVYLQDVSMTIEFGLTWMDDFKEEWTERFPDRKASSSYADVFYNGNLVYRDVYVTVDGGRTKLPLPSSRDKLDDIPRAYAQFVRLLDNFGKVSSFDTNFRSAGMSMTDKPWPILVSRAKKAHHPAVSFRSFLAALPRYSLGNSFSSQSFNSGHQISETSVSAGRIAEFSALNRLFGISFNGPQ